MARPTRTMTEQMRGRMRSVALMRELARRVAAENPHQFAGWFDKHTGMDTQASGKWRLNFSGDRPLSPQQLQLLSRLDSDVPRLYDDGPADLWCALWGDARELWPLCRTRFSNDGPMLDDCIWSAIAAEFSDEKPFGSALREFEGELLLADAYREPLTLRHLTESIAFYRLHQHINSIARSDVDGVGTYRCVCMCLDDKAVRNELELLDIYELVANQLTSMELGRVESEAPYLAALAVSDLAGYVSKPQAIISSDSRWDALGFSWVG